MTRERWLIIGGVAFAVVLAFQFFLRYQYVEYRGAITRIDRVTGSSCTMPCTPVPPPPAPTPTPGLLTNADFSLTDQRAIALAKPHAPDDYDDSKYEWKVIARANARGERPFTQETVDKLKNVYKATPIPEVVARTSRRVQDYPVREVCLCAKDDSGWFYEVHLDTSEVFTITGNADLEKKYHLTLTP